MSDLSEKLVAKADRIERYAQCFRAGEEIHDGMLEDAALLREAEARIRELEAALTGLLEWQVSPKLLERLHPIPIALSRAAGFALVTAGLAAIYLG